MQNLLSLYLAIQFKKALPSDIKTIVSSEDIAQLREAMIQNKRAFVAEQRLKNLRKPVEKKVAWFNTEEDYECLLRFIGFCEDNLVENIWELGLIYLQQHAKEIKNFSSTSFLLIQHWLKSDPKPAIAYYEEHIKTGVDDSYHNKVSQLLVDHYLEEATNAFKSIKDPLNIISLFTQAYDEAERMVAYILWLRARKVSDEAILESGILHQFAKYHFYAGFGSENRVFFRFYKILGELANSIVTMANSISNLIYTNKRFLINGRIQELQLKGLEPTREALLVFTDITNADIDEYNEKFIFEEMLPYSLTGKVKHKAEIKAIEPDPWKKIVINPRRLDITGTAFKWCFELFGFPYLVETLSPRHYEAFFQSLNVHFNNKSQQGWSLKKVSDLITQLYRNEVSLGIEPSKSKSELKSKVLENVVHLLQEATYVEMANTPEYWSLFYLLPYKPELTAHLTAEKIQKFISNVKPNVLSGRLALLAYLFVNLPYDTPLSITVYQTMVITLLNDRRLREENTLYVLKNAPSSYYDFLQQLVIPLVSSLKQSIDTIAQEGLSQDNFYALQDAWLVSSRKVDLLKELAHQAKGTALKTDFPSDKYDFQLQLVQALSETLKGDDFNLEAILNVFYPEPIEEADQEEARPVSERELLVIKILTSIDDERIPPQAVGLLETAPIQRKDWRAQLYEDKTVQQWAVIGEAPSFLRYIVVGMPQEELVSLFLGLLNEAKGKMLSVFLPYMETNSIIEKQTLIDILSDSLSRNPEPECIKFLLDLPGIYQLNQDEVSRMSDKLLQALVEAAALKNDLTPYWQSILLLVNHTGANAPHQVFIDKALLVASENRNWDMAKTILQLTAKNKPTPEVFNSALYLAAWHGQWELVMPYIEAEPVSLSQRFLIMLLNKAVLDKKEANITNIVALLLSKIERRSLDIENARIILEQAIKNSNWDTLKLVLTHPNKLLNEHKSLALERVSTCDGEKDLLADLLQRDAENPRSAYEYIDYLLAAAGAVAWNNALYLWQRFKGAPVGEVEASNPDLSAELIRKVKKFLEHAAKAGKNELAQDVIHYLSANYDKATAREVFQQAQEGGQIDTMRMLRSGEQKITPTHEEINQIFKALDLKKYPAIIWNFAEWLVDKEGGEILTKETLSRILKNTAEENSDVSITEVMWAQIEVLFPYVDEDAKSAVYHAALKSERWGLVAGVLNEIVKKLATLNLEALAPIYFKLEPVVDKAVAAKQEEIVKNINLIKEAYLEAEKEVAEAERAAAEKSKPESAPKPTFFASNPPVRKPAESASHSVPAAKNSAAKASPEDVLARFKKALAHKEWDLVKRIASLHPHVISLGKDPLKIIATEKCHPPQKVIKFIKASVAYKKIYNKRGALAQQTPEQRLLSAKALLNDYTKDNSAVSRFVHLHWNRHYTKKVHLIVCRINNPKEMGRNIISVEGLIDALDTLVIKHPSGSLARRIAFIKYQHEGLQAEPASRQGLYR